VYDHLVNPSLYRGWINEVTQRRIDLLGPQCMTGPQRHFSELVVVVGRSRADRRNDCYLFFDVNADKPSPERGWVKNHESPMN
jgi:hypothetical protein